MPRLPRFQHLQSHLCPAGSAITETIHQRVVGLACEQGVARGDKLRTDTTVVESHVHYPTDSSLLGDGIRVLSRSLQRIARECKNGALEVVDHGRAVKHRLLEISRAAKCLTEANQQRMRDSYQKLVGLTRRVVRQASAVVQRWGKGRLKVVGKLLRVETQIGPLRHFLPLVKKVIRPTKERVEGGNRHAEEKVLSLFEPHTEVIRKGKAHKPNELVGWCGLTRWKTGSLAATKFYPAMPPIPRPGFQLSNNIKLALGERRRWPLATEDFSPLKTSGRGKLWE
jgi:hypothetical protein